MIPIVAALLESGLSLLGKAVLGKGKEIVEAKLGVDINSLLGSEEGRAKLLELENSHKEALLKFALDETKLEHDNTADARKMQSVALTQDDLFSKRFIYILAAGWSLFSMLYIGTITFSTIPAANVRFADTILGFILGTMISTIINFFFGSSKSSHQKDDTIAAAVKNIKQG